jgi:hypothetical protein
VHLHIAQQVFGLDEGREPVLSGEVYLALVFAEFGFYVVESECLVYGCFCFSGESFVSFVSEEAVFIDLAVAVAGEGAESDVMFPGAGEVEECGAEGGGVDDAEVGLYVRCFEEDAGLGVA